MHDPFNDAALLHFFGAGAGKPETKPHHRRKLIGIPPFGHPLTAAQIKKFEVELTDILCQHDGIGLISLLHRCQNGVLSQDQLVDRVGGLHTEGHPSDGLPLEKTASWKGGREVGDHAESGKFTRRVGQEGIVGQVQFMHDGRSQCIVDGADRNAVAMRFHRCRDTDLRAFHDRLPGSEDGHHQSTQDAHRDHDFDQGKTSLTVCESECHRYLGRLDRLLAMLGRHSKMLLRVLRMLFSASQWMV